MRRVSRAAMFVLALTVWVGMQGVGIAQAPAAGPIVVIETTKGTIPSRRTRRKPRRRWRTSSSW